MQGTAAHRRDDQYPKGRPRDRGASAESTTILYYDTLYYTTLHYTTLHYTTLHYTILYDTIRYDPIRSDPILSYPILDHAIIFYVILHYSISYKSILRIVYNIPCVLYHVLRYTMISLQLQGIASETRRAGQGPCKLSCRS